MSLHVHGYECVCEAQLENIAVFALVPGRGCEQEEHTRLMSKPTSLFETLTESCSRAFAYAHAHDAVALPPPIASGGCGHNQRYYGRAAAEVTGRSG